MRDAYEVAVSGEVYVCSPMITCLKCLTGTLLQKPKPVPDDGNLDSKKFDALQKRKLARVHDSHLTIQRCDAVIDALYNLTAEMENLRASIRESHEQYEKDL